MRCVICVGDVHLEEKIQSAIAQNPGMIAVGFAADWKHCELLINEYCPEVLVLADAVPPTACVLEAAWPLVLKITNGKGESQDATAVSADSSPEELKRAFRGMQGRVIEQKSLELRDMLSNYLETTAKRYREAFQVIDLDTIRVINVEDVAFISVEGNYAILNTNLGVFKFRETLNNLAESLDPERFVRIHRSAIVNLSVVERLVEGREGASVVLRDGTRLQLGPTFKGLEIWPMTKSGH